MAPACFELADHRFQPGDLPAQAGELLIDTGEAPVEDAAPLHRVVGRVELLAGQPAGSLVLEKPADLGDREPGVVAEALDEAEPVDVELVEEPVVAC